MIETDTDRPVLSGSHALYPSPAQVCAWTQRRSVELRKNA